MAYMNNKAAGRDLSQPKTPATQNKASNQEQFTGNGSKSVGNPNPSSGGSTFNSTPREFGNQVKFAANTKGTSTLKNALNSYKQTNLSAAVNPGPEGKSQTANKKAPGKN